MAKSAKRPKTAKYVQSKSRTKTTYAVKKFPRLNSVTKKGGD
jgi:hypothetical protein